MTEGTTEKDKEMGNMVGGVKSQKIRVKKSKRHLPHFIRSKTSVIGQCTNILRATVTQIMLPVKLKHEVFLRKHFLLGGNIFYELYRLHKMLMHL